MLKQANAVATAVSTRALTPKTAILMAAVMNFIGALTFTGVSNGACNARKC
jgi:PiT family inorganic phosphate transporter